MAASRDTSINVDLTTCSICFETFKIPKYFPCLHSFCEGCIKTYISTTFVQTKDGVNCPVCRMYVSKPVDIKVEEWSTKLPTNHILVSLIDMNESKSEQKLCTACARENETESASSWCINCAESLCKSCERSHRRNKYTSAHKLVDFGSPQIPDVQLHHADIQCIDHPDKNVEAYCTDHSSVCCMTCVMLKHRKCDNVGSIHDAAEEMKKSKEVDSFSDALTELKKELNTMIQYTKENLQDFNKDIEKIKSNVDTLFTKISDHLDRLKFHIMSEISKIENEARPEIDDKHAEFQCKISAIENDLALFQTNVKYAPSAQFLQSIDKLMEQRMILEKFVKEECQKLQEIRVTFDANEKLVAIENDIKLFGKVNIKRTRRDSLVRSTDKHLKISSAVPIFFSEVDTVAPMTGIALLENGQIILSNNNNRTLELRDHKCSRILSSLSLPRHPWGVKMTSDTEGAVALQGHGLMTFYIQNNQIKQIKEIRMNVNSDFVYHQCKYYVGCNQKKIAVYDSYLSKFRDISVNNDVDNITIRDDTSLCYTESWGNTLYCIKMDGTSVFTYSHDKLKGTRGVTVDHYGHIYVCGYDSRNVHQLSHDGKLKNIIIYNLPSKPYCVSLNKRGDKAALCCHRKILLYDIKYMKL